MLTIEEILTDLKTRNLSKVAKETGFSYQQLWKITSGKVINPSYKSIKALSDYILSLRG
jgi:DNA-binding phage protein